MKKVFKRIFIISGLSVISITGLFLFLMFIGIIWRSPGYYTPKEIFQPGVPIMSMDEYDTVSYHEQPYIYKLENLKGSVYILGIEHTKDPDDPQIEIIDSIWQEYKPDVALAESRLGFLFSWFQDPVKTYGENGETVRLAKDSGIPYYTWEPDKNAEIKYLLTMYTPKQISLFYSLRPYFSNFRFGKPDDANSVMNDYISSRTDYDHIRGEISDYSDIDSLWKADFPNEKDWRETSDEYGLPEGYLNEIWKSSNKFRNIHMCSVIVELVNKGNKVFVTMGSSHAFRIENSLRNKIDNQ